MGESEKGRARAGAWTRAREKESVCCSVLQCVAVCCNVLQCVAVCYSVTHALEQGMYFECMLQRVAECSI